VGEEGETRERKKSWMKIAFCGTVGERKQWVKMMCRRTQTAQIITLDQIEVPAKLLDYFVLCNKNNINQQDKCK